MLEAFTFSDFPEQISKNLIWFWKIRIWGKLSFLILAKVPWSLYLLSFLIFELAVSAFIMIVEVMVLVSNSLKIKASIHWFSHPLWSPNLVLLKLLMSNNMDGILEAVRVFGNLSQDRDICDFIVEKNGEWHLRS